MPTAYRATGFIQEQNQKRQLLFNAKQCVTPK